MERSLSRTVVGSKVRMAWNHNKSWNVSKVRSYFSHKKDVEKILKIYIPKTDFEYKKFDSILNRVKFRLNRLKHLDEKP